MRREVILLALVGACFDPPPPADGPYVESHVETRVYPETSLPALDMLLVVDDTAAMIPYASRGPELATAVASTLQSIGDGFLNLQVAVTTNGGALSTVLADRVDWFGIHTSSFEGTLADNLASLVNVGTTAPGPAQPLDAMRRALASTGFVRQYAYLVVVTVAASDDASPAFDYVHFVKSVKSDPANVIALGIYPPGSPNLDAFHQSFPNRNTVVSIDRPYVDAFTLLTQVQRDAGGIPCLETNLVDIAPDAPGLQPECEVSAWEDNVELGRVAMCEGAAPTPDPCFEIAPEPFCETGVSFRLRGVWEWFHPEIRVECVTSP